MVEKESARSRIFSETYFLENYDCSDKTVVVIVRIYFILGKFKNIYIYNFLSNSLSTIAHVITFNFSLHIQRWFIEQSHKIAVSACAQRNRFVECNLDALSGCGTTTSLNPPRLIPLVPPNILTIFNRMLIAGITWKRSLLGDRPRVTFAIRATCCMLPASVVNLPMW